jgi:hypothetical protein
MMGNVDGRGEVRAKWDEGVRDVTVALARTVKNRADGVDDSGAQIRTVGPPAIRMSNHPTIPGKLPRLQLARATLAEAAPPKLSA